MVIDPIFADVFVLPLVGPVVAAAVLLLAGPRRPVGPVLLALGLLAPTFLLAQCLLSALGWCLHPAAAAPPAPLPWYAEVLLAPACYLYLRVLSGESLRRPRAWRRLLPGLGQVGLFAGVAVLGLGYRQVAAPVAGPPHPAGHAVGQLVAPLAVFCYGLLLLHGLKTLPGPRRHDLAALDAHPAPPPGGERALRLLLLLGFGLGLSFVALDAWFGPLAYSERWYAFLVRGGLVCGLAAVGLQARQPESRPGAGAGGQRWPAGPPTSVPPPELAWPAPPAPAPPVSRERLAPRAAPVLPAELRPWRERLLALMAEQRPWLEPDLTLADLAQRLGTHASFLSKVINAGCGQSFNDFVNGYRVAEAQRLLADPGFAHYSLVGVALQSGFNSKSTFNRAFKKLTERAPSEVPRPKA